jgi:hypothetical protein
MTRTPASVRRPWSLSKIFQNVQESSRTFENLPEPSKGSYGGAGKEHVSVVRSGATVVRCEHLRIQRVQGYLADNKPHQPETLP